MTIASNLADQLVRRRDELAAYAANIAMYTALVANDPGEWPADLITMREWPPHEAAGQVPVERIPELARLQQHDRSRFLLATETLEHTKMQTLIDGLQAAILEQHHNNKDAAAAEVNAAEERRNAAPQ